MGQKRHATERINKYKAKIDAGVIGGAYDRTKELAAKKQTGYFKEAEKLETEVKKIIDGEPVFLHHFYIAFAEEIVKLSGKFTAETLLDELAILQKKWRTRGLSIEKLIKLKRFFVTAYGTPFLLDVSALGGLDRLS
jgi:hypothetical protein